MTNNPTSPLSQKEKADTLKNDTMLRRAQAEFDLENTGRHAKAGIVVGATAAPDYMAAPNWSPQAVGVEPALGLDVNAVEPVGEKFEIDASVGDNAAVASSVAVAPAEAERSDVVSPCNVVEPPASAAPNPKSTKPRGL
jgi:hypothetical protein